jgi:hypothetical protein
MNGLRFVKKMLALNDAIKKARAVARTPGNPEQMRARFEWLHHLIWLRRRYGALEIPPLKMRELDAEE